MEQNKKNFKLVSNKKTRILLPNMFTLVGVCIGLSSIKFAFDENFILSILAIIVAAIIDGLDGRIARLVQGTSKVGKELDSLTDVISFGVAPAFIMYFWKLNEIGRVGWLICLVYVICVALRLARFNVNSDQAPSWKDNFFQGVPSPAGGVIVLMPLIYSLSDVSLRDFTIGLIAIFPGTLLFCGLGAVAGDIAKFNSNNQFILVSRDSRYIKIEDKRINLDDIELSNSKLNNNW